MSRPANSTLPPVGSSRSQHRASGRGLAAAGLADQAEGLAAADLEVDAVDGLTWPTGFLRTAAAVIGKCFLRSVTRRTGSTPDSRLAVMRSPSIGRRVARRADRAAHVGGQVAADLVAGVRSVRARACSVSQRLPGTRSVVGAARPEHAALGQSDERRRECPGSGRAGSLGRGRGAASTRGAPACTASPGGRRCRATEPCSTEATAVHDDDLVGHVGDDAEVVGDDDDRGAELALEVLEQVEDLRLHGDVEGRGRLVGDEQARVVHQGHRDHHALAHAAGELVRVVVDPPVRRSGCRPGRASRWPACARRPCSRPWWTRYGLDELLADRVEGVQRSTAGPGRSSPSRCRAACAAVVARSPTSSSPSRSTSPVMLAVLRLCRPMIAWLTSRSCRSRTRRRWRASGRARPRSDAVDRADEAVLGGELDARGRGRRGRAGDSAHAHISLTRGSMTAYRRSTIRFATMMNVAVTRVIPTTSGRSASTTELTRSEPRPGRLKISR